MPKPIPLVSGFMSPVPKVPTLIWGRTELFGWAQGLLRQLDPVYNMTVTPKLVWGSVGFLFNLPPDPMGF